MVEPTQAMDDIILYGNNLQQGSNFNFPNNSNNILDNSTTIIDEGNTIVELQRPELLKQDVHMVVLLSLAYIIVFLLAVINNTLVIVVIYKNQQLRTVTNYFLANLAAADITVSFIVLPITLLSNLFTGKYLVIMSFAVNIICTCKNKNRNFHQQLSINDPLIYILSCFTVEENVLAKNINVGGFSIDGLNCMQFAHYR